MIRKIRRRYFLTGAVLIAVLLMAVYLFVSLFTRNRILNENIENLRATASFHSDLRDLWGQTPYWTPTFAEGTLVVLLYDDFTVRSTFSSDGAPELDRGTFLNIVSACRHREAESGLLSEYNFTYYISYEADPHLLILKPWDNAAATIQTVRLSTAGTLALLLVILLIALWFSTRMATNIIVTYTRKQDEFLAAASHELKTPLAVIKANLSVLEAHPEQTVEAQHKWFGYIQEETDRMSELVTGLLEVSRLRRDRQEEALSVLDLSDLVRGELLMFEPMAFERGRAIADDIQPDVFVSGNDTKLRRLVVILLDNASKYSAEHSTVTVRLKATETAVTLAVHNHGTPIPPEAQKTIFEPFFTVDESHARTSGGYGLGLALAHGIAEQHGGQIAVHSTTEEGTTFTVTLRRAHPPLPGAPRA